LTCLERAPADTFHVDLQVRDPPDPSKPPARGAGLEIDAQTCPAWKRPTRCEHQFFARLTENTQRPRRMGSSRLQAECKYQALRPSAIVQWRAAWAEGSSRPLPRRGASARLRLRSESRRFTPCRGKSLKSSGRGPRPKPKSFEGQRLLGARCRPKHRGERPAASSMCRGRTRSIQRLSFHPPR
jgi:hypothetical protein